MVLLALCALTAIGAARLLAHTGARLRLGVVALLAVTIFAEGWAAPLRIAAFDPGGRVDDRDAYRWLARQPEGAAIELPILEWSIAPTLTYQYATLAHRHPIVNGYSGYGSPLQQFLGGAASPLNDLEHVDQVLELLRAIGVRYALVHPADYADPRVGTDTLIALRRGQTAAEDFDRLACPRFDYAMNLCRPPRRRPRLAIACPRRPFT